MKGRPSSIRRSEGEQSRNPLLPILSEKYVPGAGRLLLCLTYCERLRHRTRPTHATGPHHLRWSCGRWRREATLRLLLMNAARRSEPLAGFDRKIGKRNKQGALTSDVRSSHQGRARAHKGINPKCHTPLITLGPTSIDLQHMGSSPDRAERCCAVGPGELSLAPSLFFPLSHMAFLSAVNTAEESHRSGRCRRHHRQPYKKQGRCHGGICCTMCKNRMPTVPILRFRRSTRAVGCIS